MCMDVRLKSIVFSWSLRPGKGLSQTGMAILDVGLLSGFSLNQDAIQTDDVVRRIETPPGRVILYLNTVSSCFCYLELELFQFLTLTVTLSQVTTSERCVDIPTILDFKVANVQDAVVLIYDYYEPRKPP